MATDMEKEMQKHLAAADEQPSGLRTDRHNNPIASVYTPIFTNYLDKAGIQYKKGDAFPNNPALHTLAYNSPEDGINASKVILQNSPEAIQWYSNHTGSKVFKEYGIGSPQDFSKLPEETQNEVVKRISSEEKSKVFPQMDTSAVNSNPLLGQMQGELKGLTAPESTTAVGASPQKTSVAQDINTLFSNWGGQAIAVANGLEKGSGANLMHRAVNKVTDPVSNAILAKLGLNPKEAQDQSTDIVKTAETEHPLASLYGQVAGAIQPTGISNVAGDAVASKLAATQLAKQFPKLAPWLISSATGATALGTQEAVQPNATLESTLHAAKLGAILGPASKAVGNALEYGGSKIADVVLGKPGSGKFISENIGPALSRSDLNDKTAANLVSNESKLQDALEPHANDYSIALHPEMGPNEINKLAKGAEGSFSKAEANELRTIAADAIANDGKISPPQANILKRLIWQKSYVERGLKNTDKAKNLASIGSYLKTEIENAVPEAQIKKLNQLIGSGVSLKNSLQRLSKLIPALRASGEVGAALLHPHLLPLIATERAATSVPGFTSMQGAGKVLQNLPDPVLQALGISLNKTTK